MVVEDRQEVVLAGVVALLAAVASAAVAADVVVVDVNREGKSL